MAERATQIQRQHIWDWRFYLSIFCQHGIVHMGWVFAILSLTYGVERTARVDETHHGPTLEKARSFNHGLGRVESIPRKWVAIWLFAFGIGNLFFVALLRSLSIMNIRILLTCFHCT